MGISTFGEATQSPDDDSEGLWSRLGAVYGTGKDEIRISCFFHPTYRPLRLYLDGEEAVIVPVKEATNGAT